PRLTALHWRFREADKVRLTGLGSALPGTRNTMSPSRSVPVQQAPCRAVVMPPGRVPRPPEHELAKLTRRRRIQPERPATETATAYLHRAFSIRSAFKTPLDSAPR